LTFVHAKKGQKVMPLKAKGKASVLSSKSSFCAGLFFIIHVMLSNIFFRKEQETSTVACDSSLAGSRPIFAPHFNEFTCVPISEM